MKYIVVLFFIFVGLLNCFAQQNAKEVVTLENPYNTIWSHLYHLQPEHYRPGSAAKSFFPTTDSTAAVKLAIQLKQIFDSKGLFLQLSDLPKDSNYQDSSTRRYIFFPFPAYLPEIYLEKKENKWYYSKETAASIPKLHKRLYPMGTHLLANLTSKVEPQRLMGFALWQIIFIVVFGMVGLGIWFLLNRLWTRTINRLKESESIPAYLNPRHIRQSGRLLLAALISWGLKSIIPIANLLPETDDRTIIILQAIITIFFGLTAVKAADLAAQTAFFYSQKLKLKIDTILFAIGKNVIQVLVALATLFIALQHFNNW